MLVVNDVRGIPARVFIDGVLEYDENVAIDESNGDYNIYFDFKCYFATFY